PGVAPGDRRVRESLPAGWTETVPATTPHLNHLDSGAAVTGPTFGNFKNVTISGKDYVDTDGNGNDNNGAETASTALTLSLYRDSNNDGTLQTGTDTLVRTATTS